MHTGLNRCSRYRDVSSTCCVVFVVLDQVGDGAKQVFLSQVKLLRRALCPLDVVMFYSCTSVPTNTKFKLKKAFMTKT